VDLVCVVSTTPDRRRAEETGFVLTALGIAHVVERAGGGWEVRVAAADEGRARLALDDVERDHRPVRRDPAGRPPTLAGVHLAVLLAAVYLLSGPRAADGRAFAVGEADARAILAGQWWRAVTALTLHADGTHLLGNAVFAAVFVGALGGVVGSGSALLLTLVAGAAGNLLNAWLRAPLHQGVGASTAVFGALGVLSGVSFLTRWQSAQRARAWVAVGAGLALLAMLGSGERTDLGAHLFGFLLGVPLGVLVASLPRPGAVSQLVLGATALAIVGWAWGAALG
jgi:membrane associated rhomboid family serine protease